jgi:hypothetical protein
VLLGLLLLLCGCGGGGDGADPRTGEAIPAREGGVHRTRAGFAACQQKERFHEMMEYVAREESEAYRAFVADSTSGCFPLADGVEVEVVERNPTFVAIQPVGTATSVWTVAEAVEPVESGDSLPPDGL